MNQIHQRVATLAFIMAVVCAFITGRQTAASASTIWHIVTTFPPSCQRMSEGGAPPIAIESGRILVSCPDGIYAR